MQVLLVTELAVSKLRIPTELPRTEKGGAGLLVEDPRWEAIEVLHDGVAVDRPVALDAPLRERAVEADVGEPDIGMDAELGEFEDAEPAEFTVRALLVRPVPR